MVGSIAQTLTSLRERSWNCFDDAPRQSVPGTLAIYISLRDKTTPSPVLVQILFQS